MDRTIKKKFKILVACEESQTVTKQFRLLGHDAYSCDIQECNENGNKSWHIKGDVTPILLEKWDLIIAHPPCTYMSKAGARWMYPKAGIVCQERLSKAMDAKDFFNKCMNANSKYICVENPFPLKIVGLPEPTQTIQPYQFGDPFSKKTLLWLKGLPELKHTDVLTEYTTYLPSNTGGKKRGQKYKFSSITQKQSSKTFEGVAKAMAEQWSLFLENTR